MRLVGRRTGALAAWAWARAALGGGLCWVAVGPAGRALAGPADDLARLVPARGLTAYFESDGLDAHRAAWEATAASQILGGTSAGQVIADATRQAIDQLRQASPSALFGGAEVLAVQEHLTRHGFAIAVVVDGEASSAVLVVRNCAEAPDRVKSLVTLVLLGEDPPTWGSVPVRGRTIHASRPAAEGFRARLGLIPQVGVAWWLEGTSLVAVRVPRGEVDAANDPAVTRVLDAIEAKAPAAATLPLITNARAEGRDLNGFEPTGLCVATPTGDAGVIGTWLGASGNGFEEALAEALGVAQARRVVVRWGFRGRALLTAWRFEEIQGDRSRLGLLAPAGFPRDKLPPIPATAGAFLVVAPHQPTPGVLAAVARGGTVKPEFFAQVEAAGVILNDDQNQQALQGLANSLGPAWSVHAAPGNPVVGETVGTFLAGVADPAATERALDTLATRLNAYFHAQEAADAPPALVLERLPAPEVGYRLVSPSGRAPWLNDSSRPTALLGRSALALAATPELARAALAGEREPATRWAPSGETARAWECLPARLSFLIVGNPRDSFWPEAITSLATTATPALARFAGIDPRALPTPPPAPDRAAPSGLLGLLGIKPAPRPLAGPDGKSFTAADLRALIFPGVVAGGADDRGFRIIAVEALPFGCLGLRIPPPPPGQPGAISIEPVFAPTR